MESTKPAGALLFRMRSPSTFFLGFALFLVGSVSAFSGCDSKCNHHITQTHRADHRSPLDATADAAGCQELDPNILHELHRQSTKVYSIFIKLLFLICLRIVPQLWANVLQGTWWFSLPKTHAENLLMKRGRRHGR